MTLAGLRFAARADVMPLHEAEVLARALARYTPLDDIARALAQRAAEQRAGQEFLDVFGITDAREWNPRTLWEAVKKPGERLKVPLGKDAGGNIVWLDLKEAGQGGHGPHGSLAGMTGSGKSKLLRALVLALAILHPPEVCRILLGDFKGEAEFAGLEALPHVVGVVSDLSSSAAKLDRFEAVLRGELALVSEMLAEAKYDSVHDYELARATTRPDLPPIGALVIVLDEFSQLLKNPKVGAQMAAVFDEVGMQGRSKWMHILNASQRAEQTKAGWLAANQSYSMVMKVKDAGEGRAAGSALAFEEITLGKSPPGTAFLVVDGEHTKFNSFYTKGPFVAPKTAGNRTQAEDNFIDVHAFTAAVTPLPDNLIESQEPQGDEQIQTVPDIDAPTVESVLVHQIAQHGGAPARPMWLPALEETDEIPIDEMTREFWGRPWDKLEPDNGLVVPFAREDNPLRHSQGLISLDLSGALGNVVITGATGTGKSTAACTVMMMLAVSHSPQRVQIYGLDFGGGKLGRLAKLAHVAGIAGRGEEDERCRRVIAEVERVLHFRIRHWGAQGLDVAEFRARKFGGADGAVPDDGHGDVFLVVDNIKALKDSALEIHDRIVQLAEAALNYGIHLVVTCDSWIFANTAIEGKLRSRIELRLEHPEETKCVDRQAAKNVPNQPGRGLQRNGNHMLVGVPRLSGSSQQQIEPTVTAVSGLWGTRGVQSAPVLRVLPAQIGYSELPSAPPGVLKLGIGEKEMSVVGVDLTRAPHFYCAGSSTSGRTTVLATLLRAIQDTYTPEQAEVILFEPSNYDLVDTVSPQYRKVYATDSQEIEQLSTLVAEGLAARQPPRGMAADELAKWRPTGPKLFIVVDDLNLLSQGSTTSALLPLVGAIAKGRQLGVHVLAATNVERWHAGGGMNKIIAAMTIAGTAALVMDGPRTEIIVDAVRPARRVPGRGELYYRKTGGELIQVAVGTDART
jgi:S-DNA-T family DNA segregation ATPase FtsK/SpoIIIE